MVMRYNIKNTDHWPPFSQGFKNCRQLSSSTSLSEKVSPYRSDTVFLFDSFTTAAYFSMIYSFRISDEDSSPSLLLESDSSMKLLSSILKSWKRLVLSAFFCSDCFLRSSSVRTTGGGFSFFFLWGVVVAVQGVPLSAMSLSSSLRCSRAAASKALRSWFACSLKIMLEELTVKMVLKSILQIQRFSKVFQFSLPVRCSSVQSYLGPTTSWISSSLMRGKNCSRYSLFKYPI